jgi:hypothetical protein
VAEVLKGPWLLKELFVFYMCWVQRDYVFDSRGQKSNEMDVQFPRSTI